MTAAMVRGLWLLSWLGSIDSGRGVIGFTRDILLMSVWSRSVFALAMGCALDGHHIAEMMIHMNGTS